MIHWQSQEEHDKIIFLFRFASEKGTVEYLYQLSNWKILLYPKKFVLSNLLFALEIQFPNSMEDI